MVGKGMRYIVNSIIRTGLIILFGTAFVLLMCLIIQMWVIGNSYSEIDWSTTKDILKIAVISCVIASIFYHFTTEDELL